MTPHKDIFLLALGGLFIGTILGVTFIPLYAKFFDKKLKQENDEWIKKLAEEFCENSNKEDKK